jgi:hypothetical protein
MLKIVSLRLDRKQIFRLARRLEKRAIKAAQRATWQRICDLLEELLDTSQYTDGELYEIRCKLYWEYIPITLQHFRKNAPRLLAETVALAEMAPPHNHPSPKLPQKTENKF